MDRRAEILRRISLIQAELEALMHLVDLTDGLDAASAPAPVAVSVPEPTPAPAPAPTPVAAAPVAKAAPKKKVRWSYLPGTWYRISGDNPFRNGNNLAFFDHLKDTYGTTPFSREQLTEAYNGLKKKGTIETKQTEESFVLVFLRTAGPARGAIDMVAKPGDDVPPEAA